MANKLYQVVRDCGADWEVHKHGCVDVIRGVKQQRYNGEPATVSSTSAEAVVKFELDYADGELRNMGYTENHYRIMPCCADAPREPKIYAK